MPNSFLLLSGFDVVIDKKEDWMILNILGCYYP